MQVEHDKFVVKPFCMTHENIVGPTPASHPSATTPSRNLTSPQHFQDHRQPQNQQSQQQQHSAPSVQQAADAKDSRSQAQRPGEDMRDSPRAWESSERRFADGHARPAESSPQQSHAERRFEESQTEAAASRQEGGGGAAPSHSSLQAAGLPAPHPLHGSATANDLSCLQSCQCVPLPPLLPAHVPSSFVLFLVCQ